MIKNAAILNPKIKKLQFEVTTVSKKDASGECVIEGYANTNSKDRVGDVVIPSAFEKSLPIFLKNPVLLANHDWNDPCGRVLEAKITDKGLYIKARISDTREDIKTLIREGCLSTFSIGYNELDADYDESTKTKYVKELELLEISVVTVPANTEASFTVSAQKDEPAADAGKIEESKAPAIEGESEKCSNRTAKQLKDFIVTVKSVVGKDLTGNEIIGICDYFNNSKEEIMTKKELIDLLNSKKDAAASPAAAAAAGAAPAAKDDQAPAKPEDKPAGEQDPVAMIMAKLDAIAQALGKLLEDESAEDGEEKPEDKPADEGKAEEQKPEDKPADEEDGEMSDEDAEKQLEQLDAEIAALEDQSND